MEPSTYLRDVLHLGTDREDPKTPMEEGVQYYKFYVRLIKDLKPFILAQIKEKNVKMGRNAAKCLTNTRLALIGALCKKMPKCPQCLDKYDPNAPERNKDLFYSDEDTLWIEDESARLKLTGNIEVSKCFTGMIIGVIGQKIGSTFKVEQLIHPGAPPQIPFTIRQNANRYVCLMSGIEFDADNSMKRDLLFDWISGFSAAGAETSASIKRVIVCGNSYRSLDNDKEWDGEVDRSYNHIPQASIMQQVDIMYAQLASLLPVDVMTGPSDPAEHFLPQPAMHNILFPRASLVEFETKPNPYFVNHEGIQILITSGQVTLGMQKYAKLTPCECLETILQTRNLAPSAPVTTGIFPYHGEDSSPMIMKETPHLFITANQHEFQRQTYTDRNGNNTLLLSVPSFVKTSEIVLLNIDTLETEVVSF